MVSALLVRGMLVGLLAGLLVFGFARVFGEPPVERAIGFEKAADEAKAKADAAHGLHTEAEPELVSRAVQSGIGLFTGVMVYATALGGVFGLVFAVADRRAFDLRPRAVSALLAGAGFVAIYVVPTLKYPANPPSVGQPDTIGQRTALYFIMLALSVSAMVAAIAWRKHLAKRRNAWSAAAVAASGYVIAMASSMLLLPAINEVPDDFPTTVLWQFRLAAFGMQFILWTVFAVAFGILTERAAHLRWPTNRATAFRA